MFANKWAQVPNDVIPFRKSSYSEGAGSCVEVAKVTVTVEADGEFVTSFDMIAMRDSTDPHGPVHWYTIDEWEPFLRAVRAGEFDY